jgi:putative endonuclease
LTDTRQITGLEGERLAALFLQSHGYRILARRYRTRVGELDLVATIGSTLVFIEVKTRKGETFGLPTEAVGRVKQRRMAKVASHYMTRRKLSAVCRFDVVTVTWHGTDSPRIEHIRDAFRL